MNEIEKAIEYAKRWLNVLLEEPYVDVMAVRTLTASISALEAQQADRWISVTERMPTNCQRLIACNKSGNLYLSRFIDNEFIDIEYNAFNDNQENTIGDVVKWKPITTYWKEEQP
jgi:hypothetical protein